MNRRASPLLATMLLTCGAASACIEPDWTGEIALVRDATRAWSAYLATPHEERSQASNLIESNNGRVLEVARRCGQRCPSELRTALFDFVLANEGSADEQVAEAALEIYMQYESGFCSDLGSRPATEREALLAWARDGAGLTQPQPIEITCP
jgi:hypothetical protein